MRRLQQPALTVSVGYKFSVCFEKFWFEAVVDGGLETGNTKNPVEVGIHAGGVLQEVEGAVGVLVVHQLLLRLQELQKLRAVCPLLDQLRDGRVCC